MERRRITEYLDADIDAERWCCHRCGTAIGPLGESYKHGCRVRARDPREIHDPLFEGEFNMAPDPEWCNIVEYYCPSCFVLLEVEYLSPGFPPVHDIELDLEALRRTDAAANESTKVTS
jgi:acetone carboxylase gamma subunit